MNKESTSELDLKFKKNLKKIEKSIEKSTKLSTEAGISIGKLDMFSNVESSWNEWKDKKDHFTYKRREESEVYDVFFNGEHFAEYGVPFEKIIVMIVASLEKGYELGGNFLMISIIQNIRKEIAKD